MLSQEIGTVGGESFSISYKRLLGRTLGPGWLARLAAHIHSQSLDRALIAGADPAGSPQLAARAAQLTTSRTRALIAEGLERLVVAAQGPQKRWRAVSRHGHLLANAAELHELAALLRGGAPLYARGIAILNQLLTDGTGPAYLGAGESLAYLLDEARTAMDG